MIRRLCLFAFAPACLLLGASACDYTEKAAIPAGTGGAGAAGTTGKAGGGGVSGGAGVGTGGAGGA
ncbi:MAG: hypothetical protein IT374_05475, partial [Polyangiaceae bacterium]|nr:hypothetical protein [Polyangiaceae bacterium]